MSLKSTLLSWVTGVDLDKEQARGEAEDAKRAQQNLDLLNRGVWDQEQYDLAQANLSKAATGNVADQVGAAFGDGLEEGWQNLTNGVPNAVNRTLGDIIGAIFKSVPLSLWVIAAIALFVYLGGIDYLRRKLAKAS
jgi:hypothetical protein